MIYITGDTHREFSRLSRLELTEDDLVIVLGDVGINYYLDSSDDRIKKKLSKYPCRFFFVRGNHEERPENIAGYSLEHVEGIVTGDVFMEKKYPKLMFATEGLYEIGGYRCFVTNGAYSVDKYYRLQNRYRWFADEELSDAEMEETLAKTPEMIAEMDAEERKQYGHIAFVDYNSTGYICRQLINAVDPYEYGIDRKELVFIVRTC